MQRTQLYLTILVGLSWSSFCHAEEAVKTVSDENLFARENLVAWCIVPFDAKKRTPAARAEMVRDLGLYKVAYDWRKEHIASFEEEILQYKKFGIEFFAFWDWHEAMEPLVIRHKIKPQIWRTASSPQAPTEQERVSKAANAQLPIVEKASKLGLKFGLYNHGGWGGEPKNLVRVCRHLRKEFHADHVGIVYNFHHGHEDAEHFEKALKEMLPYLLCVNLNGMASRSAMKQDPKANKILPIGTGKLEQTMIETLRTSGYKGPGPIGILDHRPEVDSEISLRENLKGLDSLIN